MNSIFGSNEVQQINLNKFFCTMFMVYTITVYCFNASTEYVKYIHIAWAGVVGIAAVKVFFEIKNFVFFKETTLLILYAAYCWASSLWAKWSPTMAEDRATTVIQMVAFTVLAVHYIIQMKNVKFVIWSLIIAGAVLSLYVPLSYGGFSEYYAQATAENARVTGDINNANVIGMSCAYTVVLLFFGGMYYKKRWLYLLTVLPFIISMGAGSRKALIVVVLGIGLLLYLSQNNDKGNVVKFGKLLLIFLVAIFAFWLILKLPIMATVNKRMEGLFETLSGGKGDNSSVVRTEMIRAGWEQFKKTPFFGVGVGNSGFVCKYATGRFTYLHNDYVEQLACLGVVGFSLYYGFLLSLLISHIKLLKIRKPEVIISFVMLSIFLVNSYGMVTYYSKTTYIFFVLWISVVKIYKNKKKEEETNESVEEDIDIRDRENRTKFVENFR